jgi:CRP/FNR family cyclic AMP-dependent transcriptional regulator
MATRLLRVPCLHLPTGAWPVPERESWPGPTRGLLLLDGVAARHVALGGRVATQLLGPGDVLDPWGPASELPPSGVSWSVHEPATVAVLDGRFATASRRWPALAEIVHERRAALAERLATHVAICQLPRVEQRVLALLWHLAERFGRVTPDGVALPLRLTHRLIGELAGAQRPTVSLALATLLEDGSVTRRADGSLLLASGSYANLERGRRKLREPVLLLRGDLGAQRDGTCAAEPRGAAA